jgi:hypothetical protein
LFLTVDQAAQKYQTPCTSIPDVEQNNASENLVESIDSLFQHEDVKLDLFQDFDNFLRRFLPPAFDLFTQQRTLRLVSFEHHVQNGASQNHVEEFRTNLEVFDDVDPQEIPPETVQPRSIQDSCHQKYHKCYHKCQIACVVRGKTINSAQIVHQFEPLSSFCGQQQHQGVTGVDVEVQIDHQTKKDLNVVILGAEFRLLNVAPKDGNCVETKYKNNVASLRNGWLKTRDCWWSECQKTSSFEPKL